MANLMQDYEILTPHGWSDFSGIQKLQNRDTIKIIFDDGTDVVCTHNHRFVIDNKEVFAYNIKLDDKLQTKNSYSFMIISIRLIIGFCKYYLKYNYFILF